MTVDLATDWKFVKGDVGPAAATGNWDAVTVPHTWNDHESQMDLLGNLKPGTPYFRGPCWYARTLNVPQAWNGQRVFIRFEAASIVADVFLNGESIGAHRGAFTAFCFEITSRLQYGKDNELRVRVDNSNQADIPPLSGDFNMDGGIYRPVKLIVTNTQVLDIANPHPWNGRKDPYLYSVAVRVYRGGNVVDEVDQPLGLRTVAITQEQGFLLNGKPYPIRGVSRHQDRFNQGWALSAQDHQQDADIILGMGVTAVRNTHYPQSGTWHDLADHSGLLMWNEVSLVRTINDTPAFTAGSQLEAREMVLQLYNHPSIAFWGLFNELGNLPTPPPDVMLKQLKAEITSLDASRVIVAATDHFGKSYNQIADWTCYNTYPGWYGPAEPGPQPTIDQFSREIGKRIALSEYGAGGNPFQHHEGPIKWIGARTMSAGPLHPEEYQAAVHEADYAQIVDNPSLWGSFIWTMFDFSSNQKNEGGTIGINDKGLVTQDRAVKKDAYYFYQANWTEEPMVYITSRRLTARTLASTEIKIYSNLPAVRLKVNGHELASVAPDKLRVFRWENVNLQNGANQIEAAATGDGKSVSDHCTWILHAASN